MKMEKRIDWKDYPRTPERFREMVRQAVEQQLDLPDGASISKGEPRRGGRRRKKAQKIWLIAAAILGIGGAAWAAGGMRLKDLLKNGQVVREEQISDGELVIETEPIQEAKELTGKEDGFPGVAPITHGWEDSLLHIREAYFDGKNLFFLAEVSEEGKNFDLSLRDHGEIAGVDSLVLSFYETEEPGLYFGNMQVLDEQSLKTVLKEEGTESSGAEDSAVEIKFRVVAYPRYEGTILYTWKDEAAYRQVYGEREFLDEKGDRYYVLSQEEAAAGYTPQEITMQITVSETAREQVMSYQREGTEQNFLPEKEGAEVTAEEETAEIRSGSDSSVFDLAQFQIAENHVTGKLKGAIGSLAVNAKIVDGEETAYAGRAVAHSMTAMELFDILGEDPEDWEKEEREDSTEVWNCLTNQSSLTINENGAKYQAGTMDYARAENEAAEMMAGDGSEIASEDMDAAAGNRSWENLRQKLQKAGFEVKRTGPELSDGWEYYLISQRLEGVTAAYNSQWNCGGLAILYQGQVDSVQLPKQLTVQNSEKAELLSMEKILEKLQEYMDQGEIGLFDVEQPIDEISLEYYVDLTAQGISYRPIWNFRAYWHEMPDGTRIVAPTNDFIYMDAITGALIRDSAGW